MNRRHFLRSAGRAALLIQVLPLTARAQNKQEIDQSENQLVIESGISRFLPLADHWHYLYISFDLLNTPPSEGVSLTTSRAYLHTHTVNLTQDQLMFVANGETVTVDDTVGDHQFVIVMPKP